MYRLDNDIPTICNIVDQYIWKNNLNYIERIIIFDVRYFKVFTSEFIIKILNLNDKIENMENIFLEACMSSILENERYANIYDITEHLYILLNKIFENYGLKIDNMHLKDQLYIYIDILKNNIEFMLDNYGLDQYERLTYDNILNMDTLDKFYIIKDFILNIEINDTMLNTLCVKIYERK